MRVGMPFREGDNVSIIIETRVLLRWWSGCCMQDEVERQEADADSEVLAAIYRLRMRITNHLQQSSGVG